MKYLLILFLSIIIFSCSNNNNNNKESNNNNTDKAAINIDDSKDINQTEQSKADNTSINTNETEETTYYSYTDEEIVSFIESGDLETIKKIN